MKRLSSFCTTPPAMASSLTVFSVGNCCKQRRRTRKMASPVLGARMTPSPERGFLRTVTDFVASQEMDPQYRTVLPAR
jgi:hypothetical protein